MENIEQAKKILENNKQEKILKILDKLDNKPKHSLINSILKTDFELVNRLYNNKDAKGEKTEKIEPIKYVSKNKLNSKQIEELALLGKKVIKNNQYAVVTMAGGQGTRLGWKGPKGTFKLDVGEHGKYIFEILAETLQRANKKYGVVVNWYIMTSEENNAETVKFFEKHDFFGYDKEKIKFFKQNVLPLTDLEGNLLVDKNFNIKTASDGNGGVFESLKISGMIDDMKSKGIKWVYICGVDNIMANMVDNIFVGLAIKNKVPSASKSVKKAYPEEKVGIFCKRNGKPAIIEYNEMDETMIYAKDKHGELLYGESNIVAHLFNIETLNSLSNYKLRYHFAVKKNSYINEDLKEVIPEAPNSLKFEAFIFDGFEYLEDMVVLRVNREEEFAPIKNASGNDSPKTAKKIYDNYFLNKK